MVKYLKRGYFVPTDKNKILEELCNAYLESEECLIDVISKYRATEYRKDMILVFAENLAHFTIDSENKQLSNFSKRSLLTIDKHKMVSELLSLDDITGVQVRNETGVRGGFFLPDASEPGRYRLTLFDERGFSGHITRDSYRELVEEAREYGFTSIDDTILERLGSSASFSKGNEITSCIARVNEGRMTMKQFTNIVNKIENASNKAIEELSL